MFQNSKNQWENEQTFKVKIAEQVRGFDDISLANAYQFTMEQLQKPTINIKVEKYDIYRQLIEREMQRRIPNPFQ
jgi:hypothetical protein